jgi:hypothetical protein
MAELGIMLYGYNKSDALTIKNALDAIFNTDVLLISGSGREAHIIEEIIADKAHALFEAKEHKVLMFLGFENKQIELALAGFPGRDKVTRPIFCTLTESNITWLLNRLLQHLAEEKAYWSNKAKN